MNVHNGTNANDTNVYQKSVALNSLTNAQKFKLDYVSSTGGYYLRAMCSSNGTNRVLDVYKLNGFVSNTSNVQIYDPTDSLAQHWFIIGLGGYNFKIVPRTDMSLALTAYGDSDGTSSGTTSTSAGNIFLSTFTGSNYQQWTIYDSNLNTCHSGVNGTANGLPGTISTGSIDINEGNTFQGTYFLKNNFFDHYAEIEDQEMVAGNNVNRWDFHGEETERWVFILNEAGYYVIYSANSTGTIYYMGVDGDSTSPGADIVLRTGSITNAMKWKVEPTYSGAYRLTPKSASSMAIAVNISLSNLHLKQQIYSFDSDYKDEWIILPTKYSATVYNFFDYGYCVRYGESETVSANKIDLYINSVSEQYINLLSLDLAIPAVTYYSSAIDTCKGTVDAGNIDTLCSHANPHTILFDGINSVSSHFIGNTSPSGNNVISKAYWSGHRIQTYSGISEYNRCYSSGSSIYMVEISSSLDRNINSKGVLMHELNHQFGAPDHYHEILPDGSCRGGNICSVCGESELKRPTTCIMNNPRIDIFSSTVICSGCKDDIIYHLEDHH